jgi:K+-sensing histidine kinase KdpD
LDNIALHTPASTLAHISLEYESANAVVVIADNGPGIAAEERHRIIQPFDAATAPAQPAVVLVWRLRRRSCIFIGAHWNWRTTAPD